MTQHTVTSGEVSLAVHESGNTDGPTVILVHGFPDTQAMWDAVAERLCPHFHVVTYDVRGAGGSTAPSSRSGYLTDRLVDDLVAVRDTVATGRSVHLVGHDWGSVQLWDAVTSEDTDERLRGRIASFTSISGPSLDHIGAFARSAPKRGRVLTALRQGLHSWYVGAFQVPGAAEWVFRHQGERLQEQLNRSQRLGPDHTWQPTFVKDAVNGLELYRANVPRKPRPARTSVPVQLVVPEYDDFLLPDVYADLGEFVENLTRVDVRAGHWVPRTHPAFVADRVLEFVRHNEASQVSDR